MDVFFSDINWLLIAPLLLIQFALMIIAIVDLLRIKQTNGPKWLWLLVIIFINLLGPILYFIIGRREM